MIEMNVETVACTSSLFKDGDNNKSTLYFDESAISGRIAGISHGNDYVDEGGCLGLVSKCIMWGHDSVLEHVSMTFLITGISRACSHQLVRHRMASYTQKSQRYVKENGGFVFVQGMNDDMLKVYSDAMNNAYSAYKELIKLGMPKEDARYVLPNATTTSLYVTMNGRSIRHFLKLRLDKSAQWEIRKLAGLIYDEVIWNMPALLEGIEKEE